MISPKLLFTCVAQAVCAKGLKALAGQVPLVGALYEIAEEAWNRLKNRRQDEILANLQGCANISDADARKLADAVAQGVTGLTPEQQVRLAEYLRQLPAAARASLRRPADPAGRTVPPGLGVGGAANLLPFLPSHLPQFQPGDKPAGIGDWELVDLLGMGGFGEVWRARHSVTGKQAAMKFCTDPAAKKALVNEAHVIARVQASGEHPGIVTLIDTYLRNDPPCLKYELIEGGDLTGLVHDALTPAAATAIIAELAATVGHFHRLQVAVVHRDLKPANVLVTRDKKLKVADFGIGGVAAQRAATQSSQGTTSQQLMAESVRGACTLLYASPQQKRMDAPVPADDVYALGVIWYQLLKRDFTAEAPTGQQWVMDLRQLGVPEAEISLLASCLEYDPKYRPKDAQEMADRLVRKETATAAPPAPDRPSWLARTLVLHATALLALATVGVVGWIVYETAIKKPAPKPTQSAPK